VDFRSFVQLLEREGDLKRIEAELNPVHELAAVMKRLEKENGPAVLFESPLGYAGAKVAGNLYASERRIALGIGSNPADMQPKDIIPRLIAPLYENVKPDAFAPNLVTDGLVQECVVTDHPDVLKSIPVLTHCELDGGPYISAGMVVVKYPETDDRIIQLVEMQVKGPDRIAISPVTPMMPQAFQRAEELNVPLEIAVVIGIDPALMLASCSPAEFAGADKYALAGALKGSPIDVVKCKTVDLEVPATAEFVIEGEVVPHEKIEMGPYGDYFRTYYWEAMKPFFTVKAITHRNEPIYQALLADGYECIILIAIPIELSLYNNLKKVFPSVTQVYLPRSSNGHHAFISMKKFQEEDSKNLLYHILSNPFLPKHAIVVDDDIDISDLSAVDWALASRVQADRDVIIMPGLSGSPLDPSAGPGGVTTRMGIDATRSLSIPKERYERSDVPEAVRGKINALWGELFK
jgi:2,5-furandicarboxylate decarboxylase 1